MVKPKRERANTVAYGVQRGYPPYSLRQSRYHALAETIAAYCDRREGTLRLLDVGVGHGASRIYLEAHPCAERIDFHGADIFPRGEEYVHKHRDWTFYTCNLEDGLKGIASDQFDVVICEQVVEHVHNAPHAIRELARVLKPDGLAVIGVPIFPEGLHLVRRHVVPMLDSLTKKRRGHVQAFSKRTFVNLMRSGGFEVQKTRGFRIISGGPLRPLEHYRWWWRLNRTLGAMAPSLCVEVQAIATKAKASEATSADTTRRAA
ncbi:MAG: class I SAM-dependent methyltransferase [Planctomycetales bacterium]|nr:class I SAM-dependent methyltransferase [Planctomycetales bacterium]